jgi:protein-S-isoprenylcysteine O-methyltransferase Ste14
MAPAITRTLKMNATNARSSPDNPGVAVPPPVLFGGAFIVVLVLQWAWPLRIVREPVAVPLGLALLLFSLGIALWGRTTMHGAGTNISPLKSAIHLVVSGPYRFSRNPLYVAITLLFLGLTMLLNSWWGVILLVPVLLILHFGVVRREEKYLEQKFGEEYTAYRTRVRRYF